MLLSLCSLHFLHLFIPHGHESLIRNASKATDPLHSVSNNGLIRCSRPASQPARSNRNWRMNNWKSSFAFKNIMWTLVWITWSWIWRMFSQCHQYLGVRNKQKLTRIEAVAWSMRSPEQQEQQQQYRKMTFNASHFFVKIVCAFISLSHCMPHSFRCSITVIMNILFTISTVILLSESSSTSHSNNKITLNFADQNIVDSLQAHVSWSNSLMTVRV